MRPEYFIAPTLRSVGIYTTCPRKKMGNQLSHFDKEVDFLFLKPSQHFQLRHYALKLETYLGVDRHQSRKKSSPGFLKIRRSMEFGLIIRQRRVINTVPTQKKCASDDGARISNDSAPTLKVEGRAEWHPNLNANLSGVIDRSAGS